MKLIGLLFLLVCGSLQGVIIPTNDIRDIENTIDSNTLVLFNIAEVLLDTETQLGTQNWRKYVRQRLDSKDHDRLTLLVFEKMPPKAVDQETPKLIQRIQQKGVSVLAFTSRGRNEWYASHVPNVDLITEKALKKAGYDFSQTKGMAFDPLFYHEGIIYAGNTRDKGEVLAEFIKANQLQPSKIVFVDDKEDSLREVEGQMNKLGISFVGYAYHKTTADHKNYDPMIANIQLNYLLNFNQVISDKEAYEFKLRMAHDDPEICFKGLIENWKK